MTTRTDEWITPRDGETEESALKRRVKMHEFLMTGGIQIGLNSSGVMEYTAAIDDPVAYGPACPWHGEGCSAWAVIFAGDNDGKGERNVDGFTLAELRERYPSIARLDREQSKRDGADDRDPENDRPMVLDRIDRKIEDSRQYAPNNVALGEDNKFVASTALCERHWSRRTGTGLAEKAGLGSDPIWGKAPKSRYGCVLCMGASGGSSRVEANGEPVHVSGNPWDRLVSGTRIGGSYGTGGGGGFRRRPRLEDSRDTAIRAFDGVEEPDAIEIEGDEDE